MGSHKTGAALSYPAFSQFGKDIRCGFAAWRVYMALQPPVLDFVEAREVKVWYLRETLHMSPNSVVRSLNWLVECGYLIDAGRVSRGVRTFRLAYQVATSPTITKSVAV